MTLDALREHLRRDPFVPVRLVFADGGTWDVTQPDAVWVGHGSVDLFRPERPGSRRALEHRIVSLAKISRIESIPQRATR